MLQDRDKLVSTEPYLYIFKSCFEGNAGGIAVRPSLSVCYSEVLVVVVHGHGCVIKVLAEPERD